MSDDDLRGRLRSADPAASLPPADPAGVARLLEDTMSNDVETESRQDGLRHRSPLTWLVAAAAVVVIGGVGAFAVWNRDSDGTPVPPIGGDGEASVTELSAAAPEQTGRCLPPSPKPLAGADIAFDGTVIELQGGQATLTPSRWYAGEPTDQVTVQAPSADLQALLAAVDFEEGGRYLVAAGDDGRVMLCGFSAAYSPKLAGIYDQAFGG